jgi:hypothetical protein
MRLRLMKCFRWDIRLVSKFFPQNYMLINAYTVYQKDSKTRTTLKNSIIVSQVYKVGKKKIGTSYYQWKWGKKKKKKEKENELTQLHCVLSGGMIYLRSVLGKKNAWKLNYFFSLKSPCASE